MFRRIAMTTLLAGALVLIPAATAAAANTGNAGNSGSRYQYTVKGQHVLLRCVTFDANHFYEAQIDETGAFSSPNVLRDTTEAGLVAQMEAAGAPVTDKALAWLAEANCNDA